MSAASPPALEPPLSISTLEEGTGEGETTTWFGLPFDSLVHLASPLSDPFTPFSPVYRGRGAGADADVATGGPGNGGGGGGVSSGGFGPSPQRAAFESREVVAEAQPLSPVPEFVVVGGSGLVRAILLSNRVHALTVDTAGVIAV